VGVVMGLVVGKGYVGVRIVVEIVVGIVVSGLCVGCGWVV
jgi:hypothetical protein